MSAYLDNLMSLGPVFVAYPSVEEGATALTPIMAGTGVSGSSNSSYFGTTMAAKLQSRLPDDPAFAGVAGGVRFGNIDGLDSLTDGFTCVALLRATSRSNHWDRIISFGAEFINGEIIFSRNSATQDFNLSFWNGTTSPSNACVATTGGLFTLGAYHHIVGRYDRAAAKLSLHLNGAKVAEATGITSLAANGSRKKVGISCPTDGFSQEYMNGMNILPAIFNRPLSDSEILNLAALAQSRTLSGTARLGDTAEGASRVVGLSAGGRMAFSATPDPVSGNWSAEATKEPLSIVYFGPSGYEPQVHGMY